MPSTAWPLPFFFGVDGRSVSGAGGTEDASGVVARASLEDEESISIGSETLIMLIRFVCGIGGDIARGGGEEEGVEGVDVDGAWRNQPSNIVERRFCERVARQSPEFVLVLDVVGEDEAGAGGDFFFAVPSSSSSSSSSSSLAS